MKHSAKILALILCACALFGFAANAETAVGSEFDRPAEGCWYEVFVYSYSDSDGDGIGDLNGLKAKLDYIEYMGYDGIWLMPIMPSPSYHKYDVTDYMAVDPQYGTLDDMRALLDDCHARGIRVIIDLPINHTSLSHPWFTRAASAIKMRNLTNRYVGFYSFTQTAANKYSRLQGTDWYYEEQFSGGGMPDLNLDNPEARAEIEKIAAFWLKDVGVDGFRLDACTSYYTSADKNVEFLSWFMGLVKGIKPDCYVVGEVWSSLPVIAQYYTSGIDSCFLFPTSQAEGYIVTALRSSKPAESYVKNLLNAEKSIPEGIIAPFLCNHDTGRTIGLLSARSNPEKAKFAEGALNMYPGSVFTYYGEEIGMVGSTNDPNKRIAMNWSEDERTSPPPGADKFEYPYPGVYEQLADDASLLMYCREINLIKHDHPVIMQGRTEEILTDVSYCALRRYTDEDECVIVINFDPDNEASFTLEGAYALSAELKVGEKGITLIASDAVTELTLPPYAIGILTK